MRTTLRDVAARAGVSIKTVSNVVNGFAHVRPDTRARVQDAITELNYLPNLNARSLRNGRSGLIALAVPELDLPYFAELAKNVINAADRRGWTVLIDQTGGIRDRERVVAAGIRDQLIDGLIFSPLALAASDLAGRVATTPVVLLGERVGGRRPVADHVVIDNVAAARDATAHLATLGRRQIAAIGAQNRPSAATARLRLRGYRQALVEAGLPQDPSLVAPATAYHRADGAAAMTRLLALPQRPDAVFCFNDLLALGAVRALHEAGLRVPQDVAVVGFDDIEESRYSIPSLSTIAPDKQRIAELAVELLARRIADGTGRPEEVIADYRFVPRESTMG